jgi:hypothetical protein
MKEIAIGIDGNGVLQSFCRGHAGCQFGMQRRLSPQENQIAFLGGIAKKTEPFLDCFTAQCLRAMLACIYVAVLTMQIAGGKDMKKHIPFSSLKAHCSWLEITHFITHSDYISVLFADYK